jgi:hypothetical protein
MIGIHPSNLLPSLSKYGVLRNPVRQPKSRWQRPTCNGLPGPGSHTHSPDSLFLPPGQSCSSRRGHRSSNRFADMPRLRERGLKLAVLGCLMSVRPRPCKTSKGPSISYLYLYLYLDLYFYGVDKLPWRDSHTQLPLSLVE